MSELTVEEARAAASKCLADDPAGYAMRSCWNCNGAHERLREAEYPIVCFACGHWFYAGVDITASDDDEQEATP